MVGAFSNASVNLAKYRLKINTVSLKSLEFPVS